MSVLARLLHGDSRRELRLIGYASGNFGKNLVWSTADITLLFILTDLIGLPVTSVAVVISFAIPMFSRTAIYYSTYVLDRPAFASQILAAITLGQFGGVVVWTGLVRYFDKTRLLIASHASTLAALCIFAASAPNQTAMLV